MQRHGDTSDDPIAWSLGITFLFVVLCLIRLTVPAYPYFDEVHYLPAARSLMDGSEWLNREHPVLGKQIIGISIALLGDTPLGWRLPSVLFGGLTLLAAMRALWFALGSRFAVVAYGILLGSGFILFVQSRIAMLDVFMAAFVMTALWQCAAAVREPEHGRVRLALAGIALGLAMASKWNAVFIAMVPGVAFLAARLTAGRKRLLLSRRGIPIPGISLLEAALWLGIMPLLFYWLPHIWLYFIDQNPLQPGGFVAYHSEVIALQESVKTPHNYQSSWHQWALNIRSIWYIYEPVDGIQRGIMLIGNPLTMLLGLPALAWCAWTGIAERHPAKIAVVTLYAVSLGMWIVVSKPVQFFYHYFLPSMFLYAALAVALDRLWHAGWRGLTTALLTTSAVLFAYFYPILSAGALDGKMAFLKWMWLPSWT